MNGEKSLNKNNGYYLTPIKRENAQSAINGEYSLNNH